jgi:biopolymer transport protein ExbD
MRLAKKRRPTTFEMNMTPMIDVVFLLIIFFMAVSQVTEVHKVRLQLPQLEGSRDQQLAQLTINVTAEGQRISSGREISLQQLTSLLTAELARHQHDPTQVAVVIRADQQAESRAVNEVITLLRSMQITRLRIAVEVPQ